MATSHFFNNQEVIIPGAYGQIKSGINNPALNLAFGNLLVIDTGSGVGYGGGSGVTGALETGVDTAYTFSNIRDFQTFVGGGLWWLLAQPLFNPANGVNGISSITYIRAAATTAASMSYTWSGGGSAGGVITFNVKAEGRVGNGFEHDEVRATQIVTVSGAGSTADAITLTVGGVTIATYTNISSDNIATMVAGLVSSSAELSPFSGYSVTTSDATTLTVQANRGLGAAGNSLTIVVAVTGTAAASVPSNFSSGVDGTVHIGGFATKMVAGTVDTAKFSVEFYRGDYKGLDTVVGSGLLAGEAYDNVIESLSSKNLLAKSVEFNNIQELIDWTVEDANFNANFEISGTPTVTGTGVVDSTDLSNSAGNNLATGGTETFTTTHLNTAIDSIKAQNFDFILADDWGSNGYSTSNIAILSYISSESTVKPDMYVGGGVNGSFFGQTNGSVPTAVSFNSQYVSVVHGGIGLPVSRGNKYKEYESIYHAAAMLGREAGLAPQVPMTFKNISIGKLLHQLKDNEVKQGLNSGVLMTRPDNNSFEIVKGVNTLQKNKFLINGDGATHSKQLRRISRQINKELVVNIKNQLLKQETGANRNTVSPEDVEQFVKTYLQGIEAQDTADNMILSFSNVAVSTTGDAYNVTYNFTPNFEVSFIFSEGFIIDPSV